jgi:hypothetical protein
MEEGPMKKSCLFIVILGFLVFSLAGVSYGWQGRMAGMGDPYGLLEDESDFLFHPAKIATGEGVKFYGNYRLNYSDVKKWNYKLEELGLVLGDYYSEPYRTSGHEWKNEGLVGVGFPLCMGRMGVFFQYVGQRGKFTGDILDGMDTYDFKNALDSFALRLLYGMPMGSNLKLGGEFQLSYRREKNSTFIYSRPDWGNFPWGAYDSEWNLFPFIIPYDSSYWEALFKGSLEAMMGPLKGIFTARGSFIFSSDNTYSYERFTPAAGVMDMDGKVKGWGIGIDAWLRYPFNKSMTLPFVVSFDYQEKKRNGSGPGEFDLSPWRGEYEHKEKNMKLEAGGGVDYQLAKGTKIASGLYYNYLYGRTSFIYHETFIAGPADFFPDHTDYPKSNEHRIVLRAAGEKEYTPDFALHGGLNFFYGWVKNKYEFNYNQSFFSSISTNGSHWGLIGSIGATIKLDRFEFEPFLGVGYEKFNLSGDGIDSNNYVESLKLKKGGLIAGGGLSVKF